MSASSESHDELYRLLACLEDDLLEPGDEDRLAELLHNDPQARALYYEHAILTSLLRREGSRVAASNEKVSFEDNQPCKIDSPSKVSLRRASSHRRPWLIVLAASALLALMLTVGEVTGVTHLVPTVVRIVTGEGSLVIEVDDPEVSVTLDGEDITIHGAGIHELRLRPGTHRFVATKDGLPARSELVTVEKGGRTVVAVRLEPAKSPLTSAEAASPQAQASQENRTLIGHTAPIYGVAITDDGRRVVSASQDGTVRIWDTAKGNEVARFDGHNACVYCAAILPDGKRVLSGSAVRDVNVPGAWSVCLWELETGRELNRWEGEGDGITSISISATGDQALIGSYSGRVTLWNVNQWTEVRSIQTAPRLWSVRLSPDEQRFVTACGHNVTPTGELTGGVRLRDTTTGSELIQLAANKDGAWQAVFSPSGEQIASTGTDRKVRLWNAISGEQLHVFDVPDQTTSVAWFPDGRRLLTGNYGTSNQVRLWSVEAGNEIASFDGHAGGVQSVAISGDGRWGVSGSHDGTVRVWSMPSEVHRSQ